MILLVDYYFKRKLKKVSFGSKNNSKVIFSWLNMLFRDEDYQVNKML